MATVFSTRQKVGGAAVCGSLILVGVMCVIGGALGWFSPEDGGENELDQFGNRVRTIS